MLCSICHKNEAVICYTEIVNGMKREQYMCPECAAKYTAFDGDAPGMTPGSLLAGLLTSVLGQAGIAREDDSKKTNLVCKNCGMTYNEFLKYSKFGCSECVHTFGFLLDDYLKKIQGSSEHCGKVYPGRETVFVPEVSFVGGNSPVSGKREADTDGASARPGAASEAPKPASAAASATASGDSGAVTALKRQLEAAIKAEEYEEAARIRDAIKAQKAAEQAEAKAQKAAKQAQADAQKVAGQTEAEPQKAVDQAPADVKLTEEPAAAATGSLKEATADEKMV